MEFSKFDQLIYFVEESPVADRKLLVSKVKTLFPSFEDYGVTDYLKADVGVFSVSYDDPCDFGTNPQDMLTHVEKAHLLLYPNDYYLSDYSLDMYGYNRSLGLPLREVANSLCISSMLMSMIYNGIGVSLERLVEFAKVEVFDTPRLLAKKLREIEETNSANAFLEKVFNSRYGERTRLDIKSGFDVHDDEREDKDINIVVHHVGKTVTTGTADDDDDEDYKDDED